MPRPAPPAAPSTTAAPPARAPRRRSPATAWLQQLKLLAELPYQPAVLLPSVLATLRHGVRADFGNAIQLQPDTLAPLRMTTERFSEPTTRYAQQWPQDFFELQPIATQVASDGDSLRRYALSPEYEHCRPYLHYYGPLGARWSTGVPLRDAAGRAHALLFLHRRREWGPFSDAEQALLRRARQALMPLTAPRSAAAPAPGDVPQHSLRASASIVVGQNGRFLGVSSQASRMLFDSQLPQPGDTRWASPSLEALPRAVADAARALLRHTGAGPLPPLQSSFPGLAGQFRYRVEALDAPAPEGAGADSSVRPAMLAIHVHELEPTAVALARRLMHWPLSQQEKRVLVASITCPEQQPLARHLGITTNTLKSHVNHMLRRTKAASRQALVSQILQGGDGERASFAPASGHEARAP